MESKDWLGNSSFFIQNHRKKEENIAKEDFYSTHPNSVKSFLQEFDFKSNLIWEPACGKGNISRVLKSKYNVYSTDLIDREYGDGQLNFLTCQILPKPEIDVILTNPPYKYAESFLLKALQLLPEKGLYIGFLPITFLEGKNRYKIYKNNNPKLVFVHSSRQGCDYFGRFDFINSGARAYIWAIWEKGYLGDTIIKWIPPNS